MNVNSIRASVSASSLAGKKKKESREGAAKYAFDPSVWSGQHMYYFSQRKASVIQHVLTAREEKKSARGSKKKGKESKKKAAKKKKEADTDLDASVSNLDLARVLPQAGGAAKGAAATEVIPDFPPFKMGVEHRISSICSYHGCLRHALRQDHDSAIADASMGLLNLYGSQYPNQSAKYLSLHMAAEMRKYALMMYFEASPVSGPEKLVFERLERLQNSQARVSQELVMCKRFLAKFSPTYRRLQLPFLECENGAAASQSPLPETADKASSKAGSPGLSLSLGSLPPASSVMNTAGAACEDPTQLSHLFSIEALNSFLEADYGRVIATLPDNTRVLTFTYSPKLHCLYFTVVSNNQLDTAASRSVLALSEETELVKMVEDWNQIRKSLERHILLHGSTSSASDLDVFNKKYTRITTRLSTAMKPLLEKAYLDHSAAIAGKDVILITDRVLFSLPFEGLSMFQTAKSFTREFSFYLMYQRYRSLPLRLQNGPLIEKESSLISASNLNSHTKQIIKDKVSYVSDPAREDPTLWLPRVFNHVQALFGSNWDGIGGTLSDEERAKMRASAQALKYKRGTKYGIKNRSPNPESASEGVGTDDEEADYSTSSKDDGANLNLPAGGIGTVVPSSLTSTHTPVAGEWQRLLQKSNSFVYLGFERYLSKCSPSDLASLNLTHVTLCYLGDRATNETSYRKQNKIDNQKRPTDRELSSPYNTALLLSLRGVDTVVLHQYAISSSAAGYEFCNVWDSLKLGASMGEAVQNFRTTRNEHDSKSSAVSSLMSDMRSLMAPSSREARSLALPKTPTKRPIKSPRGASKAGRDRSIRPRSTISARQHANLLEYFEGSLRIYDRYNCIVVGLSDVRY